MRAAPNEARSMTYRCAVPAPLAMTGHNSRNRADLFRPTLLGSRYREGCPLVLVLFAA